MADDPNPGLRTELMAAMAVLAPQIRGLHDLAAVSVSSDLAVEIGHQITSRERRRDLILQVIQTLDHVIVARNELEADGYPTLDGAIVVTSLLSELQEESADLLAAVAVFKPDDTAASMTVGLGTPAAKPTP